MLYLAVLLTFGTAFPALAAAVGLAVTSALYLNEIFLGRYLLYTKKINRSLTEEQLSSLERGWVEVWRCPKFCVWMVLTVSVCFFGVALFGISSDDVGLVGGAGVATTHQYCVPLSSVVSSQA